MAADAKSAARFCSLPPARFFTVFNGTTFRASLEGAGAQLLRLTSRRTFTNRRHNGDISACMRGYSARTQMRSPCLESGYVIPEDLEENHEQRKTPLCSSDIGNTSAIRDGRGKLSTIEQDPSSLLPEGPRRYRRRSHPGHGNHGQGPTAFCGGRQRLAHQGRCGDSALPGRRGNYRERSLAAVSGAW